MKKLFYMLFAIFITTAALAAKVTPIKATYLNIKVGGISSKPPSNPSNPGVGYYAFRLVIYSPSSPPDKEQGYGIPTTLGVGFINRYLHDAIYGTPPYSYFEFGYYNFQTQNTTWFPATCTITMNHSGTINVVITSTNCSYTYKSS